MTECSEFSNLYFAAWVWGEGSTSVIILGCSELDAVGGNCMVLMICPAAVMS